MRLYVIPQKKHLGKCTCLLRLTRQLQAHRLLAPGLRADCSSKSASSWHSTVHQISSICIKGLSLSLSPCYGMRFNSLFVPFEFLVLSVRSGGQDSMQHGTVVAWKKQLEYTAARSNKCGLSSQIPVRSS